MSAPTVIFYHQILRQARPEHFYFRSAPTLEQFRADMLFVQQNFTPITMQQLMEGFFGKRRYPRRAVLITFDDGFKNNLLAAQVLQELGLSATFFVLSDVIDSDFKPTYLRYGHIMAARTRHVLDTPQGPVDLNNYMQMRRWYLTTKEELLSRPQEERTAALDRLSEQLGAPPIDPLDPDYQYFSSADLREMQRLGQTLGGHSATHEKLSRCDERQLGYQLVESQRKLQALSGAPIDTISYPDGRLSRLVVDIAQKHYRMGFTASDSFPPTDAFRFPRRDVGPTARRVLSPWFRPKQQAIRFVKRLMGEKPLRWEE